jgi:hypothetical protein
MFSQGSVRVKGKSEGNYQRMGVFVVWNCTVEHAVLIYKRFSEAKLKVYAVFFHPNLVDNNRMKCFFVLVMVASIFPKTLGSNRGKCGMSPKIAFSPSYPPPFCVYLSLKGILKRSFPAGPYELFVPGYNRLIMGLKDEICVLDI